MSSAPLQPPCTLETAISKVRAAEDECNSRDPIRVSFAYTAKSDWRNRDLFIKGRGQIQKVPSSEVGARAGLSPCHRTLGLSREPDRRGLPLQMA